MTSLSGCERGSKTEAPVAAVAPTGSIGQQQAASAAASASASDVKEHAGPLDRFTTAAGEVVVSEVKAKDGAVTKALSLAGKTIYDQNDHLLSIERVFEYSDRRTVLLLATSEGGSACPSRYRFLSIRPDGSTGSTDEFGTCSDGPTITLSNDKITVSLPDMQGRGNEAWAYAHEGLSKAQSINPNVERNASQLAFTEDEPTKVRGTLVRGQGASQEWSLHLPKPTKLDGGDGSFCASIVDHLPISTSEGTSIPKVDGQSDFVATIACPRSGAVITAIRLPGAVPAPLPQQPPVAVGMPSISAEAINGEWDCKATSSDGSSQVFFLFKDRLFAYQAGKSMQMVSSNFEPSGAQGRGSFTEVTRNGKTVQASVPYEISVSSISAGKLAFSMKIAGAKGDVVSRNECGPLRAPAQQESTQNRTPPSGGDRVAAYANNLASQLAQASHPACAAFASNLRMLGNSGAPDHVRMRQVEAMLDKAPRICLQ